MTRDEALQYEQHLHSKYFEPYERLLQRKAEYYLQKTEETGLEYKLLLQEIEVMEQFREYVAMLETRAQELLDGQHRVARQAIYWKERWRETSWWRKAWHELYECSERTIIHLNIKINRLQQ